MLLGRGHPGSFRGQIALTLVGEVVECGGQALLGARLDWVCDDGNDLANSRQRQLVPDRRDSHR